MWTTGGGGSPAFWFLGEAALAADLTTQLIFKQLERNLVLRGMRANIGFKLLTWLLCGLPGEGAQAAGLSATQRFYVFLGDCSHKPWTPCMCALNIATLLHWEDKENLD